MEHIYEFYMGHTAELLGVCRRTIYRWIKSGKISSFKNISGHRKFTLKEINRIRVLQGEKPYTREQAYKKWEEMYTAKQKQK